MPKKIIDDIKITPDDHADQVLKVALTKELNGLGLIYLKKTISLKQVFNKT